MMHEFSIGSIVKIRDYDSIPADKKVKMECGRKSCAHINTELQCDYYKNNACKDNVIDDQEELRAFEQKAIEDKILAEELADRLSEIERDINNLIARKTDLEKKRDDIASALKALDNVRMGR